MNCIHTSLSKIGGRRIRYKQPPGPVKTLADGELYNALQNAKCVSGSQALWESEAIAFQHLSGSVEVYRPRGLRPRYSLLGVRRGFLH
jgi:hypothetical protein